MEALALHRTDHSFAYDQIDRQGDWALYTQTHLASGIVRYEVVRIRIRPAHTWPNGATTPAHEAYPSAEAWGRDGFTYYNRATAEAYMEKHHGLL